MKKAAVIGHPVAHSLSPKLHHYWLARYKIDGSYDALDISPDELQERLYALRDEGFIGVNVTLPHKHAVMEFCTSLTQDAQRIGAVNLIKFYPNGMIEGRNSDAYGFLENLKTVLPFSDAKGKIAVVIGAGGAARAACHALEFLDVAQTRLVNRTLHRAEAIADYYRIIIHDWDEMNAALKNADIIINTTNCGMNGDHDLDLEVDLTNPNALFYDLVYTPRQTYFLKKAKESGRKTLEGLGMLLYQAQPSFQAFFDVLPEIDDHVFASVT